MSEEQQEQQEQQEYSPSPGALRAYKMLSWQWYITIATGVFSAIAIGLAFAGWTLAAQIMMLPIAACFIGACTIAWVRYKENRTRRDAIISTLDAERDRQLIELFDSARARKKLPADAESKDGFSQTVHDLAAKARAQQNLPPGVKKRGGGGSAR
jgi:hypothetical protein